MNNFSKKISEIIEKEEIKPIPKIFFMLKYGALWLLALILITVSATSLTLIIYSLLNQDWDIYQYFNQSLFGFIVASFPLIWLIIMILALVFSVINVEKSRKGYKYQPKMVVTVAIVIMLIFGYAGYALGFGEKIDNYLGERIKNYQTVDQGKISRWNQPNSGLLSGKIVEIINKDEIKLVDFSKNEWIINIKNADVRGRVTIEIDKQVKIIGTKMADNAFWASEVRPWGNGVENNENMNNGKGNNRGYRGGNTS